MAISVVVVVVLEVFTPDHGSKPQFSLRIVPRQAVKQLISTKLALGLN
jgi:hypothetical protein